MGLFSRGKSGGVMNIIRCDQQDYLVWKWRPLGQEVNSTSRENGIRFGSSLRVRDGEVAVFVYRQKNGQMQDVITGPYTETIKTANFPVLASIMGAAFGGDAPFQAEVYYINMARNIQIPFTIPYFDVYDHRYPEFGVPTAIRGKITFGISDYSEFIRLNKLTNFSLDDLQNQIRDAVMKIVKGFVVGAPERFGIFAYQLERKVMEISDLLQDRLKSDLGADFGINLHRVDISNISCDEESEGYIRLRSFAADYQAEYIETQNKINLETLRAQGAANVETLRTQTEVNLQNLRDTQEINKENVQDTLRRQREEGQYAQHLQSQSANLGVYSLDKQAEVLKAGVENLGQMGAMNLGSDSGNMNPAGMMTGMAMGGAIGQQMAGMMNTMGQQMNQQMAAQPGTQPGAQQGMGTAPTGASTPPPLPGSQPDPTFMVAVNGQPAGPFNLTQMQQLVANGQLNQQSLVWTQGLSSWIQASAHPLLARLFAPQSAPAMPAGVPPVPGMPPMP